MLPERRDRWRDRFEYHSLTARPPLGECRRKPAASPAAPLFDLSTRQLARFYLLTKGKMPLVGAGGISNADQAWSKICAGASLLQLYSALVFKGPELVREILDGLSLKLAEKKFLKLSDAVGCSAEQIAHHNPLGR